MKPLNYEPIIQLFECTCTHLIDEELFHLVPGHKVFPPEPRVAPHGSNLLVALQHTHDTLSYNIQQVQLVSNINKLFLHTQKPQQEYFQFILASLTAVSASYYNTQSLVNVQLQKSIFRKQSISCLNQVFHKTITTVCVWSDTAAWTSGSPLCRDQLLCAPYVIVQMYHWSTGLVSAKNSSTQDTVSHY